MIRTTIESEEEYRRCLARFEEIFDSKPGDEHESEMIILAVMIQEYEDKHYPIDKP